MLAESVPQTAVVLISSYERDDLGELIAQSPVAGFIPKIELGRPAIERLLN